MNLSKEDLLAISSLFDKRFDRIDRQFEKIVYSLRQSSTRLDKVDSRIDGLRSRLDGRIDGLEAQRQQNGRTQKPGWEGLKPG